MKILLHLMIPLLVFCSCSLAQSKKVKKYNNAFIADITQVGDTTLSLVFIFSKKRDDTPCFIDTIKRGRSVIIENIEPGVYRFEVLTKRVISGVYYTLTLYSFSEPEIPNLVIFEIKNNEIIYFKGSSPGHEQEVDSESKVVDFPRENEKVAESIDGRTLKSIKIFKYSKKTLKNIMENKKIEDK